MDVDVICTRPCVCPRFLPYYSWGYLIFTVFIKAAGFFWQISVTVSQSFQHTLWTSLCFHSEWKRFSFKASSLFISCSGISLCPNTHWSKWELGMNEHRELSPWYRELSLCECLWMQQLPKQLFPTWSLSSQFQSVSWCDGACRRFLAQMYEDMSSFCSSITSYPRYKYVRA